MHIFLNGIDVFHVFLNRIRVVKAQIAFAAEFLCKTEVDADGFGMADMQIAVGFGRKRVCTLPPKRPLSLSCAMRTRRKS